MARQETNSLGPITGPRPQQRGSLSDGVVFVDGIVFTYYYTALPGTDYSFAFVLTQLDTDQNMLTPTPYNALQPVNYYHELSNYDVQIRSLIGVTTSALYNGLEITMLQSTFKLAARAFCDPTRYLLAGVPDINTVHTFVNSPAMPMSCDQSGTFVRDIRYAVCRLRLDIVCFSASFCSRSYA